MHTWWAKLVEGKVTMEMLTMPLTDDEVADGYILTCQSQLQLLPNVVVVDYDHRLRSQLKN